MTCVHFLLTKARDKNVYSLKLIREKSSRLSTETDHRLCTKKREKNTHGYLQTPLLPRGQTGVWTAQNWVRSCQWSTERNFQRFFIPKQHRNFVQELFYSKSTSIYINNRMLLYETLFKAILAQLRISFKYQEPDSKTCWPKNGIFEHSTRFSFPYS